LIDRRVMSVNRYRIADGGVDALKIRAMRPVNDQG